MKNLIYSLILCFTQISALSLAAPTVRCSSLKKAKTYVNIGAPRPNESLLKSLPLTIEAKKYEMDIKFTEYFHQDQMLTGELIERTFNKTNHNNNSFELLWSPLSSKSPNGELRIYTSGSRKSSPDTYKLTCSTVLQVH